jgi:GTP cyclohydrolase I
MSLDLDALRGAHDDVARDARVRFAAQKFAEFMSALGFDPESSEHLAGTPDRVARMYWDLFHPEPTTITTFPSPWNNMVIVKDIPLASFCAHHWLPFVGTVSVGYIPHKEIIGLSKIPRIVHRIAAQPQVQEQMTHDVKTYLIEAAQSPDVAVVVKGRHSCMEIRGVKSSGEMITSAMAGAFAANATTRSEFLEFVR